LKWHELSSYLALAYLPKPLLQSKPTNWPYQLLLVCWCEGAIRICPLEEHTICVLLRGCFDLPLYIHSGLIQQLYHSTFYRFKTNKKHPIIINKIKMSSICSIAINNQIVYSSIFWRIQFIYVTRAPRMRCQLHWLWAQVRVRSSSPHV